MSDVAEKKNISNVLSARYASPEMAEIWSPEHKIILERQLWIAVMKAQKDLGVDIPAQAIAAYEEQVENVDLASIAQRDASRRESTHRGVQRSGRLRAHSQGNDLA